MVARIQPAAPAEDVVEVQLRRPIDTGDRIITTVRVREPQVGDLLSSADASSDPERAAMLVAAVTGIAFPHIKRMSLRDYQAVQDAMDTFMGKDPSPETGTTS